MTIYEAFFTYSEETMKEERITDKEQEKQIEKIRNGLELARIYLSGNEGETK